MGRSGLVCLLAMFTASAWAVPVDPRESIRAPLGDQAPNSASLTSSGLPMFRIEQTTDGRIRRNIPKQFLDRPKPTAEHQVPEWLTYSGRPLMAVGTIHSIDFTSGVLVVNIDPTRSKLPNMVANQARGVGALDALRRREFPPVRTFQLTPRTLLYDARESHAKPPVHAITGLIRRDPERLAPSEYHPGDAVTVLYRMTATTSTPAIVMNLSRIDPGQSPRLDFNPLNRRVSLKTSDTLRLTSSGLNLTSVSQRRGSAAAAKNPRGAIHHLESTTKTIPAMVLPLR